MEITEFPYNTVQDRPKEVPMPKTNSIRSAILTELRLVTDGQTYDDSIYHTSIASRGKTVKSYNKKSTNMILDTHDQLNIKNWQKQMHGPNV